MKKKYFRFSMFDVRFPLLGIAAFFHISCGKTPEPVRDFGNNLLHQTFTEVSSTEFLLTQEKSLRFLTSDYKTKYLLTEKLPIDKTFFQAVGDKNIIYLLTNGGIEVFKKKDKEESYENISKIAGINKCDLLVKNNDFLYVGTGISQCDSSIPKLNIYSVADPSKPSLFHAISINEPTDIKIYKNLIFISEGNKGMRVLDFDGKIAPKELLKIEDKKVFNTNYNPTTKLLIARNLEEIYQFDLSNFSKLTLLSTIKIDK